MPIWAIFVVFLACLLLSAASSYVLADTIEKIGGHWRLTAGLLGIVSALGADSPEISTAITALLSGQHDIGVGVVLGSNLFNLAALLGLSALTVGSLTVPRLSWLLNGGVAGVVTLIFAALLLGWLSAPISGILLLVIFLPYIVISSLHPTSLRHLTLPAQSQNVIQKFLEQLNSVSTATKKPSHAPMRDLFIVFPCLIAIILASIGLVRTAEVIGQQWHLSQTVIGLLVLASLTGIPNVIAAQRLAHHRKGAALVSEALNSNALNGMVGLVLPALVVGLGNVSRQMTNALWGLLALTALTLLLISFHNSLTRWKGVSIVVGYLVILVAIFWIH